MTQSKLDGQGPPAGAEVAGGNVLDQPTAPQSAWPRVFFWMGASIVACGVLLGFAPLFAYFTRYSQFDGLLGVIDDKLYRDITEMFDVERAFLVTGALLLAVGVVLLVTAAVGRSRARGRSTR